MKDSSDMAAPVKRPPTLPTLLNRARAALRKAEAALYAQRKADREVLIEAGRQAIVALARRGVERKAMVEIVEPGARRWHPGRFRLERIEVWPSRRFADSSPCWKGAVQLTAFNARGKALLTPVKVSWELLHPRDLAHMIELCPPAGVPA